MQAVINLIMIYLAFHRLLLNYPRIDTGFIRWIWDIWTMDTNTFYTHAGFDALVFRLYLKGCLYICIASLPYALCVLLPVYATSEVKNKNTSPFRIIPTVECKDIINI